MERMEYVPDGYVTAGQYAEMQGVKCSNVNAWIQTGRLKSVKVGLKKYVPASAPRPARTQLRGYVSVVEYAEQNEISADVLRKLIHNREVPYVKVRGKYFVPETLTCTALEVPMHSGGFRTMWDIAS